jgi:hypothetical protein
VANQKERKVGEAEAVYAAEAHEESHRSDPDLLADFQWLQANQRRLEVEYAGKWIAVADGKVVGSGVRLTTAMKRAKANGYEQPLIHGFRPAHLRGKVIIGSWS